MPLAAGTRLGVFEILAPLGNGVMGKVCRAKDTKLEREVALKILPRGPHPRRDARKREELGRTRRWGRGGTSRTART